MDELLPLIHSKNQKLVDDFAAGDAAALVSSFYTDDACLIAPDGKVTKGLPGITNLFARLLQSRTPSFDVRPRTDDHAADTNGSGDLIYVIGGYAFALADAGRDDGLEAFEGNGNRLVIFKRSADGLKAVVDVFSRASGD